jgi:hypothetical protein
MIVKTHSVFIFALLLSLNSFSQAWESRIVEPGGMIGLLSSIPTQDGGLITAGAVGPQSRFPYAVKLDETGFPEWSLTIHDSLTPSSNVMYVGALRNGYVAAHQRLLVNGLSGVAIHRLTISGQIVDTLILSYSLHNEYPTWVDTASDGNILLGVTQYNVAAYCDGYRLIKLDTNLQVLWTTFLPISDPQTLGATYAPDSDGGVVVATSFTSDSAFYTSVDSAGNVDWIKTYTGFLHTGICRAPNGGYCSIVFDPLSLSLGIPPSVFQMDSLCDSLRMTPVVLSSGEEFAMQRLLGIAYANNSYYVFGRMQDTITFDYVGAMVVRIDTNGNILWFRHVGASVSMWTNALGEMPQGGCTVVGSTDFLLGNDGYVIRIDSAGNTANAWIAGSLYADTNASCTPDSAEPQLAGAIVTAINTVTTQQVWTVSSMDGSFILPADTGSWNVNFTPTIGYYTPSCSFASGFSGSVQQQFDSLFGQVPFEMIPNIHDLRVHLIAIVPPRPGRNFTYQLQFTNAGSCIESGSVNFRLDSIFTIDSTSSLPDTTNGNTLTWNFSNLAPLASSSIYIHAYCDSTLAIGTPSQQDAWIFPVVNDTTPNDNSFTHHQNVMASYDPNLKEVSPNGIGPAGNIPPQQGYLTYTVHFQNTGNDTAFNIVVRDSLSQYLDPGTLQVLGASHPYVTTMTNDGVVSFRFLNILLPDSFVNEPASHGYVVFRIAVRPNLSDGTIIENIAGIYFDFNTVVMTNTVINTIDYWLGVESSTEIQNTVSIYPNPALEYFSVATNSIYSGMYTITDLAGRELQSAVFSGSTFTVNRNNIPAGCYVLYLTDENGVLVSSCRIVFCSSL